MSIFKGLIFFSINNLMKKLLSLFTIYYLEYEIKNQRLFETKSEESNS